MRAVPDAKAAFQSNKQPPSEAMIEAAILKTVAYVDVFDYPLTAGEVHRYLAGAFTPPGTVESILANGHLVPRYLSRQREYFTLPGREAIVAVRQRREAIAQRLWPKALTYGRQIAALPFTRMVAVTGSLAVNNAEIGADIDYLIVTENDRLWLCRAFIILLVRLAARRGVWLCPNYFLSERALVFTERNLYTAHELTQMVPISGLDVYQRLRQLNAWTADFLPNAHYLPPQTTLPLTFPPVVNYPWRTLAEAVLRTPAGALLEQWEMQRKVRKFSRQLAGESGHDGANETAFSPDWCKGHFDGHGQRVLETFNTRLDKVRGEGRELKA